jgi:hypothetical protein
MGIVEDFTEYHALHLLDVSSAPPAQLRYCAQILAQFYVNLLPSDVEVVHRWFAPAY